MYELLGTNKNLKTERKNSISWARCVGEGGVDQKFQANSHTMSNRQKYIYMTTNDIPRMKKEPFFCMKVQ